MLKDPSSTSSATTTSGRTSTSSSQYGSSKKRQRVTGHTDDLESLEREDPRFYKYARTNWRPLLEFMEKYRQKS